MPVPAEWKTAWSQGQQEKASKPTPNQGVSGPEMVDASPTKRRTKQRREDRKKLGKGPPSIAGDGRKTGKKEN